MTEKTTHTKKKFSIWTALVGLLLAALVVLFLLPSLVSTDWAGNKIKQVINDRLPGAIDFETLSVSWFSGIKSSAISYDNRQHGIVIKVAELSTVKGLLALAVNHKELGSIDVKEPVAYVFLTGKLAIAGSKTEGSPAQESKIPEKTGQDAAITPQDETAKNGGRVMLPPLTGDIVVSDGALHIVYPDSKETSLLKDLTLQT
ncbi:MAG: hypothetical protein HKP41_20460, partial [Desulfobacterales bacterium]|nr:hypothetical protein [Desulfobacterales bacterium]